ncbi:MAG: ATP phosphoribosyltransferase regulatory subunit [Thermaceae bacterium]
MRPEGTRFYLPPEARLRQELLERLRKLFYSFGYEPVELPALEAFDPTHPLAQKAFKLVDRTGEVLVLRSEFTVALARMLKVDPPPLLPARFQYAGPLWLRERDPELGRLREYTQIGVEYVGATGPLADAEILALALEALNALGLKGVLEVGLPGLVGEVLKATGFPQDLQARLQAAIHRKNTPELTLLLKTHPTPWAKTLLALPDLYGEREVLGEALRLELPEKARADLLALERTLDLLGTPVLLDLGMARRFDYYTGLFFRAYTEGFGLPLLGGGRYDGVLLDKAAGFALGLERVMTALGPTLAQDTPPEVLALDLATFRSLRAQGLRVELAWTEDREALIAYARRRGIRMIGEKGEVYPC